MLRTAQRLRNKREQVAQWSRLFKRARRGVEKTTMRWLAWGLVLGAAAVPLAPLQAAVFTGPVELRVDDLHTPLGLDDPAPRFSWQLQDPARGAKQNAYQVLVGSPAELLRQGKPDVWDSGRIESDEAQIG